MLPTVSHSSLVLVSQQSDSVFVKESPDCKHYLHSAAVSLVATYSIDCAPHDICQDSKSVEVEHPPVICGNQEQSGGGLCCETTAFGMSDTHPLHTASESGPVEKPS